MIPRDKDGDYRESVADARRRFVTKRTGAELDHVAQYSIDPSILPAPWTGRHQQLAIALEGTMSAVGTKRTSRDVRNLVAIGRKGDMAVTSADFRV
jgi:hypothetical protein